MEKITENEPMLSLPKGAVGKRLKRLFKPTRKAQVGVGAIKLPLRLGKDDGSQQAALQRALHHMAMQQAAGVNHLGHPRGFRIAPTSRKNPEFHRKRPATRVEALTKRAFA
jgi:hypothetical protein